MASTKLFFIGFCLCLSLSFSKVIWNKPADWNRGLPASVQVFQTNSSYIEGVKLTASYCLIDPSDTNLELKVVHSEGKNMKTPPQYIEAESDDVLMIANGGFFNMITNISQSLVISNGKVVAFSLNATYGNFKKHSVPHYPTRGAFGVYPNGTADLAWTYSINNDFTNVYRYPLPAPNCAGCPPQMVPGKILPKGGQPWTVKEALGGGPMLVKDGVVNVTSAQEMMFTSDVRNPRTAVCITKDKKVAVIAVDGRYTLSDGLLLKELGGLMIEIGCQNALNLDGGGSTAMIVNGYLTNRPSDPQGYRAVPSALMLVSKKKKIDQ